MELADSILAQVLPAIVVLMVRDIFGWPGVVIAVLALGYLGKYGWPF